RPHRLRLSRQKRRAEQQPRQGRLPEHGHLSAPPREKASHDRSVIACRIERRTGGCNRGFDEGWSVTGLEVAADHSPSLAFPFASSTPAPPPDAGVTADSVRRPRAP